MPEYYIPKTNYDYSAYKKEERENNLAECGDLDELFGESFLDQSNYKFK